MIDQNHVFKVENKKVSTLSSLKLDSMCLGFRCLENGGLVAALFPKHRHFPKENINGERLCTKQLLYNENRNDYSAMHVIRSHVIASRHPDPRRCCIDSSRVDPQLTSSVRPIPRH